MSIFVPPRHEKKCDNCWTAFIKASDGSITRHGMGAARLCKRCYDALKADWQMANPSG